MEALKRCALGAARLARTSQALNTSMSKNAAATSYILNNRKFRSLHSFTFVISLKFPFITFSNQTKVALLPHKPNKVLPTKVALCPLLVP